MGFLRQIFSRQKPAESDTVELTDDLVEFIDAPPVAPIVETVSEELTPWKATHPLLVGFASHVGQIRERNEDSALVVTSSTVGDSALPPFGLFVVADGMGGHSDGQKASQLAVRLVAKDVMGEIFAPFLQVDSSEPSRPVQDILSESIHTANWRVNNSVPESGTTLTAALVLGNRLYMAHVGDSRAYLLGESDSSLDLLTVDHTYVQRLQDTGQISAAEANVHPQRNIVYRAVGQGEKLEVDTFSKSIPCPGWLLLCSDGLWGLVAPELIHAVTTSVVSPQHACDELVQAALDAGGPDNISIIIARFEQLPPSPSAEAPTITSVD